jgi:FkbM family methyltransferase
MAKEFIKPVSSEYIKTLTEAVLAVAHDPYNPELNFWCGLKYEEAGQTASAFSFHQRAAETTQDDNLAYECLCRLGLIFERQGRRGNSARCMFQHALCLLPRRPEAYVLLARHYENCGDNPLAYQYADLGLKTADFNQEPLHTHIEYMGRWQLKFHKMVSAWWWGKDVECRDLLRDLKENHRNEMDQGHINAVQNNLNRLGITRESMVYRTYFMDNDYHKLRYRFAGSEQVQRNWSQIYQDLFVLSMLNGKRNGTYLEIGTAGPLDGNNTKLLEHKFGWKGWGIEWDENFVKEYEKDRKNPVIHGDALQVDYKKLLTDISDNRGVVDYLQLDCEPARVTYEIMEKIPFDDFKFAVITYEHDDYVDMTGKYRQLSRNFLHARGYLLVANDLSTEGESNFEDWWVHPDLIDGDILTRMRSISDHTQDARRYMLPGFNQFAPPAFQYGLINQNKWFLAMLDGEMFRDTNLYERMFPVEKDDVVLDLGASVGPFAYCAAKKDPKIVLAVEPHPQLVPTLRHNLDPFTNVIIEPKAVGAETGKFEIHGLFDADAKWADENRKNEAECITFMDLIRTYEIDQIDFLKIDIEGMEYEVFNDDNKEWIFANVRKIAGEFHLNNENEKKKFRKFRDTYLTELGKDRVKVLSADLVDITHSLWDGDGQWFIDFYREVTLFMDNR